MPDTPAPGGDTLHAERGPEALSPLPGEEREPLAGPRQEAERPRETDTPLQKLPTSAEAEARSAGGQAARALVGTELPAEIPEPPSVEPPRPTTRRVQPFALSALKLTAERQTGLKEKAT